MSEVESSNRSAADQRIGHEGTHTGGRAARAALAGSVRAVRTTVGRLLTAGFVLAVIALLTVGGSSYLQTGSLVRDRAPVERTHQVLNHIDGLLSTFTDAETGQRGYVITGEDDYLAPCPQSLAAIADNLAALSDLTADNPRQQATFAQLQAPVHDKLAELAETITLRRTQGFAAAPSVVLTNRGAGSMATIREPLDNMRSEENRLLAKRADQRRRCRPHPARDPVGVAARSAARRGRRPGGSPGFFATNGSSLDRVGHEG